MRVRLSVQISKAIKKISLLLIISLLSVFCVGVSAAGKFDAARDTINTRALNAFATHNIAFGLPVDADDILSNEYIIIDFPSFNGISAPTSISGNYTGVPQLSVIETRVRITGLNIPAGTFITVSGVTGYNPSLPELFDVYIRHSTDTDGLNVKLISRVQATPTTGSIIVSAAIPSDIGVLSISGYSAPGMFITFSEGDTILGTCTAENNGFFTQIFPGLRPEDHTITIVGIDQLQRYTSQTLVQVYTRARETTTVTGLILPPTISLDKEQISRGDEITVSGRGTPGYKTIIATEPPVNTYEVTVDENGDYTHTITDTEDMEYGDHKVNALVQDNLGTQSIFSISVFFRVSDGTEPPGGEPECDITRGDLNCDESVNLIDFSILLYYWGGTEVSADINNDGHINLIDFSIMMFYWQG